MSKVKIEGNASGTGTFTIAAPNSNTDRSITLPDAAGELLLANGDGSSLTGIAIPEQRAFSAYMGSNQSLSGSTWTKLNMATEEFDPDSIYDTTNKRCTPDVEGYYHFHAHMWTDNVADQWRLALYKNGSFHKRSIIYGTTSSGQGINVSSIIYMNGTTDYVEVYAYVGTTSIPTSGSQYTYWEGNLVRAA